MIKNNSTGLNRLSHYHIERFNPVLVWGVEPKLWGTQHLVLSYAWVFYITCDQREPNTIYFKGDINIKGNMCVYKNAKRS